MTPIPITPQDQPKFPCWLWHPAHRAWFHWEGNYSHVNAPVHNKGYTHYHPDQPEAPEPITSEPASRAAPDVHDIGKLYMRLDCDRERSEAMHFFMATLGARETKDTILTKLHHAIEQSLGL